VTGHLVAVKPGTEGVAFQHERNRLTEIAEAAGCSKASASDYRRRTWTPHVSTWAALAELAGLEVAATTSLVKSDPAGDDVPQDGKRRLTLASEPQWR
jgi:hypothetical protein